MITLDELKRNISEVKIKIESAMRRAGRSDEVTIVGASKTMPIEVIEAVDKHRLLDVLGENRVQELAEKRAYTGHVSWHMIGTLQTNKVKHVVGNVSLIESLDRFALADEINKQSVKLGIISDCLLQINMGREESKSGFFIENVRSALDRLKNDYRGINIRGVMAVMPIADEERLIQLYKELRILYLDLQNYYGLDTLSAGMTNDYHLAIEYAHSNTVRIGRAIFGERCYGSQETGNETQTEK